MANVYFAGFSEFVFVKEPEDTVVVRNRPVILHCSVHFQLTSPGPVIDSETAKSRPSPLTIHWLRDAVEVNTSVNSNR